MPLPVIANTYRVALNWVGAAGQVAENVIHVTNASSTDETLGVLDDVHAALTAAEAGSGVFLFSGIWNSMSLVSLTGTKLDNASPSQTISVGFSGHSSGEILPAYACVITLYSVHRGRRGRGRIYLGPLSEQSCTNGKVATAILAEMQAGFDAFSGHLDGAHGNNSQLVVASYTGLASYQFLSSLARVNCGIQRRRQTSMVGRA